MLWRCALGFLGMGGPSIPAVPAAPPAAAPATLANPAVSMAGNNQKAAAAAAAIASGMSPTNMGAPATATSKLLGPS